MMPQAGRDGGYRVLACPCLEGCVPCTVQTHTHTADDDDLAMITSFPKKHANTRRGEASTKQYVGFGASGVITWCPT